MNIKGVLVGLKMLLPLIGDLKQMLFIDGKFNPIRAFYLILFLIILIDSISFIGVDDTNEAIDMLDEISDVIGQTD